MPIQIGTTILSDSLSWLESYVSKAGGAYISILLGVMGAFIARRAQNIMFAEERVDNGERELVTEGIYSSIRHPIYLGFRLISAAAVFYNPSAENLIVAGTVFGISELTARIEEKKMKIVYPQRYDDYAARVSRWMPKFSDIGTFTNEIKKYFSTIIRTPSKW